MNGRGKQFTALVVASFGWGSAGTFTKYALDSWGPMTLIAVELIAANIVLWLVLLIRGYGRRPPLARLIVLGALEPGISYALITIGLTRTSAANTAVLTGTETCMVVLLAAVFLKERIGPRALAGTALAVAGVISLHGFHGIAEINLGDLLVLAGTLSAAVHVLVTRDLARDLDTVTMTAHQFLAGLLLILPFSAYRWSTGEETIDFSIPWHSWVVAVLIGVCGYGGSFLLYNYALASVPAGLSAIITNLIPVFGLCTAVLVLSETLALHAILGAVLVLASIAIFPREDDFATASPVDRPPPNRAKHGEGHGRR
ncbi:DMT family transporter [Amycolatopsis anabasis]|uniref:DMT family transporter n=1 Tax=Amycolatopsis anabasis TaxID=1840409 RepID=UPI00131C4517|nr:DMT family transporter [Amycolatopsis anabasis]